MLEAIFHCSLWSSPTSIGNFSSTRVKKVVWKSVAGVLYDFVKTSRENGKNIYQKLEEKKYFNGHYRQLLDQNGIEGAIGV